MTFSGNPKSYVVIEDKGRRARFAGELCTRYIALSAYSMKWLPPDEPENTKNTIPVTDEERNAFIKAVRRFLRKHRFRYFPMKFFDDTGKRFRYRGRS